MAWNHILETWGTLLLIHVLNQEDGITDCHFRDEYRTGRMSILEASIWFRSFEMKSKVLFIN